MLLVRRYDRRVAEELDVLKSVARRLDEAQIPYMITGSMAANYYAVPRMTRDIDVVVDLSPADADRVCGLFEDFYLEPDAVRTAIAERTMFNAIHTESVVKVDFVMRKDTEYRREELQRRRRVTIDDDAIFIVAPEDLIISKLDWARETRSPIQLADVRNLLGTVPDDRMNDTPIAMEIRYRQMLMQRSSAERLKMGCSMLATARALIVASVRERAPDISSEGLRRALFLRLYRDDFSADERQRIMGGLDTGLRRPAEAS